MAKAKVQNVEDGPANEYALVCRSRRSTTATSVSHRSITGKVGYKSC
jgi:hypothetical protein